MPFTLIQCAGGIGICGNRAVQALQLFLGKEDMHLAQIPGVHIFVLGCELAAGDKRKKNNQTEVKRPQDFMQTLIPQIGLSLVLRLPLL